MYLSWLSESYQFLTFWPCCMACVLQLVLPFFSITALNLCNYASNVRFTFIQSFVSNLHVSEDDAAGGMQNVN